MKRYTVVYIRMFLALSILICLGQGCQHTEPGPPESRICASPSAPAPHEVGPRQSRGIAGDSSNTASDEFELAKRTRERFSGASAEELRRLLNDANCGLALSSAWEQVRRTVSNQEDGSPDAAAISRFLRLVERRLQVPLPPTWVEGVQEAYLEDGAYMAFYVREYVEVLRAERPVPDPPAKVECDDTHCTVAYAGESWKLPLPMPGSISRASVHVDGNRAYIAIYGWPRSSYLYAVDRDSGRVCWSNAIWGGGGRAMPSSGAHWLNVDLRVRGDCLFAFGISAEAAYIEAFDMNTGENLWRFGTGYHEKE